MHSVYVCSWSTAAGIANVCIQGFRKSFPSNRKLKICAAPSLNLYVLQKHTQTKRSPIEDVLPQKSSYVGPCHHGTARHQVGDVWDGLQMWRVAANILDKQCRAAEKGWPSTLGITPHSKKKKKLLIGKCHTEPRNWTENRSDTWNMEC